MTARDDVPVLIAGGGLVGLSTAMFLAQPRRPVARRRAPPGRFAPAARGALPRAHLELFRAAGIEDAVIEQSAQEFLPEGAIIAMDDLSGKKLADIIPSLNVGVDDDLSPCRRLFVSQPGLEPILRKVARTAGAAVLEGHEVVGAEAGRRGRHRDRPRRRHGRGADPAGPLPGRRRRRAQHPAGAPRHPVRRARRVLQQPHHLLHRGSPAAARGQAAQRHLHQQPDLRRVLPRRQGLPVRLPGGEHRRRPDRRSGGRRERGGRHQRGPPARARAGRRGRARPGRADRRGGPLAGQLGRRPALPGRPRPAGRRRRPRDAAQRRLRRQHRHPGRLRPRVEAGLRGARGRRPRAARHLRGRASAGRRPDRRAGLHPLRDPHRDVPRRRPTSSRSSRTSRSSSGTCTARPASRSRTATARSTPTRAPPTPAPAHERRTSGSTATARGSRCSTSSAAPSSSSPARAGWRGETSPPARPPRTRGSSWRSTAWAVPTSRRRARRSTSATACRRPAPCSCARTASWPGGPDPTRRPSRPRSAPRSPPRSGRVGA